MMEKKGFVYSLDAVFAMIAVIALTGALFTQSTLSNARNSQFQSLQSKADENAWVSFYFAQNHNASPNATVSQFDCDEYLTYNPDNFRKCSSAAGAVGAQRCDCFTTYPGPLLPANMVRCPFPCDNNDNSPYTCLWQYGPDANILIKTTCRSST